MQHLFLVVFPPLGFVVHRAKKSEEKEGGIARCALIPAALIADLPEGNNAAWHQVHRGDCSLPRAIRGCLLTCLAGRVGPLLPSVVRAAEAAAGEVVLRIHPTQDHRNHR